MLQAIALLFLLQVLGEAVVRLAGWPLPGAVVGMLALFALLLALRRVPAGLDRTAQSVLPHMMLLFVPSVAGVALHAERVAREWLPFLAASLAGAAITLAVTALTLRCLLARRPADDAPTA